MDVKKIQDIFSNWLVSEEGRFWGEHVANGYTPYVYKVSDDLYLLRVNDVIFFLYRGIMYSETAFYYLLCGDVDLLSESCPIKVGGSPIHYLWIGLKEHYRDLSIPAFLFNGNILFVRPKTRDEYLTLLIYKVGVDNKLTAVPFKEMV